MHIGHVQKPSKNECILFPPTVFFKHSSRSYPVIDIYSSQFTIPAKKDNEKKKRQREDKSYDEANEMNSITVLDVFVTFTNHFRYLGIFVLYNIRNAYDVDIILA